MADKTLNLKLNKPGYGEDADVEVFNENMDILDEKVGPAVKFIPELLGSRDQILRNNGDGTTRWDYAAIDTEVASAVTEWMDEHVSAGYAIAVDDDLLIEGCAADAKAAGDRIRTLEYDVDGLESAVDIIDSSVDALESSVSSLASSLSSLASAVGAFEITDDDNGNVTIYI